MSIVDAFDVQRRQLTFDYLDAVTGEVERCRVAPADREHLRAWLARFTGQDEVQFAVEGCMGGGMWSRNWPLAGSGRTWPSQLIPPRRAGDTIC